MNRVSIVETSEYSPQCLDSAVESHFQLLGLDCVLPPGAWVVLKANLLMKRSPEEATTTHPELVAAVARALKRRGAKRITLADSPGGPYTRAALTGVYQLTGMTEMARREGIELNLDTGWETVRAPEGKRAAEFNLIEPVARADLVVNLCKLKTHCMTGLSGAVKNLFGCVPGLQKPELHYRFKKPDEFCDMLVDLCETVRPAFTLVDAVTAMEGDGPSGGTPVHVGLTLASRNPHGLDAALCRLIGMPEERAYTLAAARRRGLAIPFSEIQLVGRPELLEREPLRQPAVKAVDFNARLPGWMRRPADWITDRLVSPRPVIRRARCVGCGKCAESCPAKTIRVEGRKARICYENCIRCYCCHEMCPVKAISIRKNPLLRF